MGMYIHSQAGESVVGGGRAGGGEEREERREEERRGEREERGERLREAQAPAALRPLSRGGGGARRALSERSERAEGLGLGLGLGAERAERDRGGGAPPCTTVQRHHVQEETPLFGRNIEH